MQMQELIPEIKRRSPILEIARELGIEVPEGNKAHCFRPERHKHGDRSPSLAFFPQADPEKDRFKCFVCDDVGGDVIDLVEQRNGFGKKEAIEFLKKRAGIMDITPRVLSLDQKVAKVQQKLRENKEGQEYLKSRGFREETIEKLKIGFDDGTIFGHRFKNMIVFPYLKSGKATYIKGSAIEKNAGGKRHHENIGGTIPGLYNETALKDAEEVFLCEGETDTITLAQEGFVSVGAPGVQGFKKQWVQKLKGKRVFIVWDNDKPGIEEAQRLSNLLAEEGIERYLLSLPEGVKDVNEVYLQNKKDFPHIILSLMVEALKKEKLYVSADEFLRTMPDETKPLIKGEILPREGTMFIGGQAKGYKTMFALQMAISLVRGESFLDHDIKTPVKVLYIGQEISPANLWKRLKKMVGDENLESLNNLYIYTGDPLKLDTEKGLNTLRKVVEETSTDVVVLDPLYKFWNVNENSAEDVGRFLDNLDKVKSERKAAFVIVHHHRKPSFLAGRDGPNQLRGSSVLFAYGDAYLTLSECKKRGKGYRMLSYELRNAEAPLDKILRFDSDSLFFEVEAIVKETAKVISAEEIIDYLKQVGEEAEQRAIYEHFEGQASKTSIKNCLTAMEGKYIEKYRSGKKHFIRLIGEGEKLF